MDSWLTWMHLHNLYTTFLQQPDSVTLQSILWESLAFARHRVNRLTKSELDSSTNLQALNLCRKGPSQSERLWNWYPLLNVCSYGLTYLLWFDLASSMRCSTQLISRCMNFPRSGCRQAIERFHSLTSTLLIYSSKLPYMQNFLPHGFFSFQLLLLSSSDRAPTIT